MPRADRWERTPAQLPDSLPPRHEGHYRMSARFDVLVVGAGPGGLVAACTAADAGVRVCLIDDNPSAGGQIWRSGIAETNPEAARLLRHLETVRVDTRFGWR